MSTADRMRGRIADLEAVASTLRRLLDLAGSSAVTGQHLTAMRDGAEVAEWIEALANASRRALRLLDPDPLDLPRRLVREAGRGMPPPLVTATDEARRQALAAADAFALDPLDFELATYSLGAAAIRAASLTGATEEVSDRRGLWVWSLGLAIEEGDP